MSSTFSHLRAAKHRFESLITRSEPKKVLAHESDKRPAVDAAVDALPDLTDADDFDV